MPPSARPLVTIRPHQHALPLAGAGRPTAAPAPPPPSGYRRIHVSDFDRRGQDFYATPNWVTEALLQRFQFRGPIWEPCCVAGAMSTVFTAHGYEVVSTDIADCGFGTPGVDFLASRRCSRRLSQHHNQPAVRRGSRPRRTGKVAEGVLDFLRHALALTATVQGHLALLVRLQ